MADEPRFVAFDVHKSYVLIAALDAQLQVVLKPRRVKMEDLATWVNPGVASERSGRAGSDHQCLDDL